MDSILFMVGLGVELIIYMDYLVLFRSESSNVWVSNVNFNRFS